jgi:hypothetical protein
MLKRSLLFAALAVLAAPAVASLCTLATTDQTCTFATDTSGGTALFTNPSNLSNIGSGVINPFLGTQVGGNGGVEFGVSTDIPNVNILPLDDKRDNANTFTQTFRLNQLGFVTVGGVDYFDFFLDINEPNGQDTRFLSIDTLRIWGRTGVNPDASFLLDNTNVTSLADLDLIANLQLVYALGPANTLILDYNLFAGSGLGYDMEFLIPTSQFAGLAPNSRILFSVGYGGADAVVPGSLAQDGFEEWAFRPGTGPRIVVPEPSVLSLFGLGLAVVGLGRIRRVR